MTKIDPEKLREFLVIFGAENGLNEAKEEKIERILVKIEHPSMTKVKRVCELLVKNHWIELPEEEIFEKLREAM